MSFVVNNHSVFYRKKKKDLIYKKIHACDTSLISVISNTNFNVTMVQLFSQNFAIICSVCYFFLEIFRNIQEQITHTPVWNLSHVWN